MLRLVNSLVLVSTVVFLGLATAQGEPAVALAAGILSLVAAAALGGRHAAAVLRARAITTGRPARRPRQALRVQVSPQHPLTPGRPRTRAPSRVLAAQ